MYKILVVDDEPANLNLIQNMLRDEYRLSFATSGKKALDIARKIKPDLILLDVMMPDLNGYETCKRLKASESTAKIPVIFLTALKDSDSEIQGFEAGAVDFIKKPITSRILVEKRIKTHIMLYNQQLKCEKAIRERTRELNISNKAAVAMLANAGHYNDTDTGVHVWRMGAYSSAIARASGWDIDDANILELAASMHDTGKIGISDTIIRKPARLSTDEFAVMKEHATIGYDILHVKRAQSKLFAMAADIAISHHEKWDGSGYPRGLSGEDIPESARIAAIADVFDALTMKRPYKDAWPLDKAFDLIKHDRGTHFDPRLVDIFFSIKDEILTIKVEWDDKERDEQYEWFFDELNKISS
ncbi:HD-GYP domain-containing protein [Chitinivibrio alkaliphilus]|uniref:Two-component system response regulator (Hybrid family) protein n=1 Tax=Chitinivibrio alkaliphilus ACht1 TaxID=1313304 RepID=U7DAU9_9BACT|nr:HD domain-containing phosphohydrolase [Chitinivibrio alkaliphilus]ERP39157.1 two-component system response regulator (hybrid family) protein [Chitinivibrio alkaliphilus ACht1]